MGVAGSTFDGYQVVGRASRAGRRVLRAAHPTEGRLRIHLDLQVYETPVAA